MIDQMIAKHVPQHTREPKIVSCAPSGNNIRGPWLNKNHLNYGDFEAMKPNTKGWLNPNIS